MKHVIIIILFILPFTPDFYTQQQFITCTSNKFFLNGENFYFLGYSAYYLQSLAADLSKRYIVDDVFRTANRYGIKVIRIWGFNSGSSPVNSSVIRSAPYTVEEKAMEALDYVIYKAGVYDIHLIITIENYYNDYGGLKQYLNWADNLLKPVTNKTYVSSDFYTDDSLKSWYKYYVSILLNRINHLNNIAYKNDPAIMSFELINEAANPGKNERILQEWYAEMSDHFKQIDHNHLLTTGEEGYDCPGGSYSDINLFYNGSHFLFNGSKGTSFLNNSALPDIDFTSFHMYPDSWGFDHIAGNTWINDHIFIAEASGKAALLGEFGVRGEKYADYKKYLESIMITPSRSAVVWGYMHPDIMSMSDKYGFNEIQDPFLMELFREHAAKIDSISLLPEINSIELSQNYPNPFNPSTTIRYTLSGTEYVIIDLFNSLGECVGILQQGIKNQGQHEIYLSFNNSLLGSGVYFYRMRVGEFIETKKLLLLK